MPMDDISGRRALLRASGLKKGRILDVGMGDCCCMSFFLARRGFDVVGIDRSPHAVHEARMRSAKTRCSGSFTARKASADRLPFDHEAFEGVIAYNSFHHMDGIGKAVREMFRVCKNKGQVIISDPHDNGPESGILLRKIERLLAGQAQSIKELSTRHNRVFICRK